MIKQEIKELIRTLKDDDTNYMEFRKDLAEMAPLPEIEELMKDEKISAPELVEILETYI